MNIYLILFEILFIYHDGLAQDVEDLNATEILKILADINDVTRPLNAKPSDVAFYLVSRSNPEPFLLSSGNISALNNTKKTKFIIHGYIESRRRSYYKQIAEEYLRLYDLNFIQVDWERLARYPYLTSVKAAEFVAIQVANFIKTANLSLKDVHLIGHSLGGQVVGFVGQKILQDTGRKLNRISALDPSGPAFRTRDPKERLDKADAEIVDVIHTDGGVLGFEYPTGSLDIYVNGGRRIQPSCLIPDVFPLTLGNLILNLICSHIISHQYFKEWIRIGKFDCKFCDSLFGVNLLGENCLRYTTRTFGAEDVDTNLTGVCFARTNIEEPYLT